MTEVVEHPNYRTISVSGAVASHQPMNIQLIIYSEELDVAEAMREPKSGARVRTKRILECRLFMDPYVAKKIHKSLLEHITNFEKKFGPIPSDEEIRDRFAPDKMK